MASPPNYDWDVAERIESELLVMLNDPKTSHENINRHLELFRLAIIAVTANNFQEGIDNKADARLWHVTCAINNRFRKLLAKFKGDDRKVAVEKSKVAKRYANFIKTSQLFYKSYIQGLSAQYGSVAGLSKIARRLDLQIEPKKQRIEPTPELRSAILEAVHATLVHLGDLSRYRNELRTEKNWNHALAYYGLAGDLMPDDGAAYNQMAMVALKDQNHLHGVYYLYRAFAVEQPHPRAKNNLELEFKKLISMWKGGVPSNTGALSTAQYTPPETAAINWLLRLHAVLYEGGQIPSYDEVETEVICQTTALLKDQSLQQDVLIKCAIINIAAERLACDRLNENPSHDNEVSYVGFLRLNVRTFFMLLQVLQPEFKSDEYDDLPGVPLENERLTPVMRHILPALRHYSTWLVSQAEQICKYTFGEARGNTANGDMALLDNLRIYVKEMWHLYASTLCMFCTAFPPRELHQVKDISYLLDEDAATVGFKPFTDSQFASDIYYDSENGKLKPRPTDQGVVVENSEDEMLSRIRTFVRDGVVIAHVLKDTPIQFSEEGDKGVFYYVEEALPAIRPTSGHSPGRSMSSMEMKRTLSQRDEIRGYPLGMTVMPDTEFTHESVDQRMNTMVEQLLTSREDNYGMNTGFGNEPFGRLVNGLGGRGFPRPAAWFTEQPFQSPFQSGQAAAGQMIPIMPGNGIHSQQAYGHVSQDVNNLPGATDQQYQLELPAHEKFLPDEEMERHLEMFENPFGGSSWNKRSSIFGGTNTPYNSNRRSPQEVTNSTSPYQQANGHHQIPSPPVVPFSSGQGMYGDSRSYERVMLQSSLSRPSGEPDQVRMYAPRGRG